MTPDEHVDLVGRLFDGVWNDTDPEVAAELVAPDYYIHDRELSEEVRGPELYRRLATTTRQMFSDATFSIDDTVAEGNEVAVRWTMTGTHDGPGYGLEPTGTTVELEAVEINRFEGGLLAETWTQSDVLGLMQQVGALPDE